MPSRDDEKGGERSVSADPRFGGGGGERGGEGSGGLLSRDLASSCSSSSDDFVRCAGGLVRKRAASDSHEIVVESWELLCNCDIVCALCERGARCRLHFPESDDDGSDLDLPPARPALRRTMSSGDFAMIVFTQELSL